MTMATDAPATYPKLYGFLIPHEEDQPITEIEIVRPSESDEEADSQDEQIGRLLGGIDFDQDARQVLIVRPTQKFPGLMGYYAASDTKKKIEDVSKNVRATCFAMACGMLNARFIGPVVILTVVATGKAEVEKRLISLEQVNAACKSPDIRPETLAALGATTFDFPSIISDGEMNNYHDRAVLTKFNRAMARRGPASVSSAGDSVDDYIFGFSDDEIEVHSGEDIITIEGFSLGTTDDNIDLGSADFDVGEEVAMRQEVVTQVPLCFHCRRPADTLDKDSGAAYFCDPPRQCRQEGWSYDCLTATWKLYCEKRDELNDLPLGTWVKELTTRECQLSNEPYEEFLNHLGIKKEDDSWWKAEFGGWSGGMSDNAQRVNLELESTFEEGFAPIKDIPPEHPVLMETLQAENWDNERGLRKITDWADYYKLRGISPDSPAALLLTFPLTLYHAIFEHCAAPIKAARMNQRPLRIDVVGAEKELHFLSLFQETSFLCPEDLPLELVFVVRKDMMPPAEKKKRDKTVTVFQKGNIRIKLIGGTYGETIDPRFDCGRACNPDAVMAFNAGLYAYESWRSAVEYLHVQKSVVGIFTDYNEWSGVQCASLGGSKARLSLSVNPFRQPRAMPVYSMNLPQVGNGFMYVFNEQEVED